MKKNVVERTVKKLHNKERLSRNFGKTYGKLLTYKDVSNKPPWKSDNRLSERHYKVHFWHFVNLGKGGYSHDKVATIDYITSNPTRAVKIYLSIDENLARKYARFLRKYRDVVKYKDRILAESPLRITVDADKYDIDKALSVNELKRIGKIGDSG